MIKTDTRYVLVFLAMCVGLGVVANSAFADTKLSGEELKKLLTGNFAKVTYIYSGKPVTMWEFYRKNGDIAGSTDEWGDFGASYEIKGDQICVSYSMAEYSGCYSYVRQSGNRYKLVDVTWPENTTADAIVVRGLVDNIQSK